MRVSFEYTDIGCSYCLSGHEDEEVKAALRCLQKMTSMTWVDVFKTAGGQQKTGLHWTVYPDTALRRVRRPAKLSPDVRIVGIRASDRQRIFGAHLDDAFYVLWFDRKHEIVPA